MRTVPIGCSFSQFRCTSGQCVSSSFQCNGFRTCSDGSDERNCRKFPFDFDCCSSCNIKLLYIAAIICTVSCQSGAFRCSNGQCVRLSDRCDGVRDCTDGSDETRCSSIAGSTSKYVSEVVYLASYTRVS